MNLPHLTLTQFIALITTTLVVYGLVSNLLLVLFRALGWTRAARITSRVGGFILTALHVAQDFSTHPDARGAQAALADMDKLGEDEPVVALAATRFRAFARLFGVTLVLVLLVALPGCSAAVAPIAKLAQTEARIVTVAEPCLVARYKQEQEDCLAGATDAKACVDGVRARWKPIVDELAGEHDTRCQLEPAKCPAAK